jgi:hypothetical protein
MTTLSREQILAATPAQLNAWLHERIAPPWDESLCRVCGWPLFPAVRNMTGASCTARSCSQRPPPRVRADAPADYAGSWEGMRLVVEAMTNAVPRGIQFSLEREDTGGKYAESWEYLAKFGHGESAYGDAAPIAVARAALLAISEAP